MVSTFSLARRVARRGLRRATPRARRLRRQGSVAARGYGAGLSSGYRRSGLSRSSRRAIRRRGLRGRATALGVRHGRQLRNARGRYARYASRRHARSVVRRLNRLDRRMTRYTR